MIKKGTRVTLSPMWKYDKAVGSVIKTTKDYTVVKWDGVNGEWHYTQDQTRRLELEHDK